MSAIPNKGCRVKQIFALVLAVAGIISNPETRQAITRAFAAAAVPQELAEPLDWMDTTTPGHWRIQGRDAQYNWYGPEGGTPFPR